MSGIILDACMPMSKKICEYHAFKSTDSRFAHSTSDEILEELSK